MQSLQQLLLSTVPGLLVAILIVIISNRLTLWRYYSEKWWEKKYETYSAIMESLYHMMHHTEQEMRDPNTKTSETIQAEEELLARSKVAREEINRITSIGAFAISEDAARRLEHLSQDLENSSKTEAWYDYLEAEYRALEACFQQMRHLAKQDLGVTRAYRVSQFKWRSLMKTIAVLALALPLNFLSAQEKPLDGYWWTGIDTQIATDKSKADKPDVKAVAQFLRTYFVLGFKQGMSKAKEAEAIYDVILKDTRYLKDVQDVNKVSAACLRVTIEQYVNGLSHFYEDYRNRQIEVVDAMDIIAMEVGGQSSEEIEWKTRYYRSDQDTRSRMLRERYKDLYK